MDRATPLRYVALRYFNVAGCYPAWGVGIKGEDSTFIIPNIMKTVTGDKKFLTIFGDDYDTPDGTCIRDYVFVVDLCLAHLMALKALDNGMESQVFNIGTGRGSSVRELISASEAITGKKINVKIGKRRDGDVAKIIASPKKAERMLKWKCKAGVEEILRTSWAWQKSLSKCQ